MTGVEISSLRVRGQTAAFGFVSNSHNFFPVVASYPRTQPSPCADTTCATTVDRSLPSSCSTSLRILATAGVDHCPCRIRFSTELSCHTSFPVVLLTAMIAGALGDGILTWLSSWPFDVLTKIRSPQTAGDEFARLCGNVPTSFIMSNDQMTSASFNPVSFSSLNGPSFSPSWKPLISRHHNTPRLLT